MEFFNKKEEVIDLKLTQFGRFLLSKGKLKPAFYSFFDDNIVYNNSHAGITEAQNDSEKRIVETPTMHPQISFSSLEKEFNNNYNKVLSGELNALEEDIQRTPEKHYALPQPMGTSDINSEYSPSWTIRFLNGSLTGSVNYLNLTEKSGGKNTQKIPQLASEMEIKMLDVSDGNGTGDTSDDFEEFEGGFAESNIIISSDNEDNMFILLKIVENNGLFQKENFDIELFEIVEEDQDGTIIETISSLSFIPDKETTSDLEFIDDAFPEVDVTYANYYFDIFVDDEIDDKILCELDPANENMGVYSDPRTRLCQDVINQQKKKVFDIYKEESDSPGDIC